MQKVETNWKKDVDWKARYSKLYSSRRNSTKSKEEIDPLRISFMSNSSPLISMQQNSGLTQMTRQDTISSTMKPPVPYFNTLLSQHSELYRSYNSSKCDSLGDNETLLLNLIRARSRELEEAEDQPLDLPNREHDYDSDESSNEACIHGLSMRLTERSISRSRVSRISTKRDMDIPSILAYNIPTSTQAPLLIPAFQKTSTENKEVPRWSIRRSLCPVCSAKWKDKSLIKNIKSSGLKKNSSTELPSVIAPARLRSITNPYCPHPALANANINTDTSSGRLKSISTAWQLTRARRYRLPKPRLPHPEATAPPKTTAPLTQNDLYMRLNRFLTDEFILNKSLTETNIYQKCQISSISQN